MGSNSSKEVQPGAIVQRNMYTYNINFIFQTEVVPLTAEDRSEAENFIANALARMEPARSSHTSEEHVQDACQLRIEDATSTTTLRSKISWIYEQFKNMSTTKKVCTVIVIVILVIITAGLTWSFLCWAWPFIVMYAGILASNLAANWPRTVIASVLEGEEFLNSDTCRQLLVNFKNGTVDAAVIWAVTKQLGWKVLNVCLMGLPSAFFDLVKVYKGQKDIYSFKTYVSFVNLLQSIFNFFHYLR